MKKPAALLAISSLAMLGLAACAQQPTQVAAPPASPPPAPVMAAPSPSADTSSTPKQWQVANTRCSVLLGAADDDRVAAVMFYYGYLAAKANIQVINTGAIEGNIAKVMDRCVAKPNITVPQAFREALSPKTAVR